MRIVPIVVALVLSVAHEAGAQTSPRPAPDFLFGQPHHSLALRGSLVFPRAGSDIFDFVTDQLTLDTGDFRAPAFAADFGFAIMPRVDLVAGFEYARSSSSSEYRRLVDNNRLPITQQTSLTQANLSASLRLALVPRGRDISRLAWIPRAVTPYAGAGGGFLWYELLQSGDFVDFLDQSIFTATLTSTGWTPSAHVLGGVDVKLHRRIYLNFEGQYLWAGATLEEDFTGFDPIDLAGARVSAGVNLLF